MSNSIVGNNTSNNNSYMTILREDNKDKKISVVNTNNNFNPDRRTHRGKGVSKVDYILTGGNVPEGVSNALRKDNK